MSLFWWARSPWAQYQSTRVYLACRLPSCYNQSHSFRICTFSLNVWIINTILFFSFSDSSVTLMKTQQWWIEVKKLWPAGCEEESLTVFTHALIINHHGERLNIADIPSIVANYTGQGCLPDFIHLFFAKSRRINKVFVPETIALTKLERFHLFWNTTKKNWTLPLAYWLKSLAEILRTNLLKLLAK